MPVSMMESYPVFAGVQDALIQWWYGHNAVAFFLTTPYLGLMYYFLPKAANRPVFLTVVDHPLLGTDLYLHLGRSSPLAVHLTYLTGHSRWVRYSRSC
jgi:cbb3-type cytochrome oxidase subunit 1